MSYDMIKKNGRRQTYLSKRCEVVWMQDEIGKDEAIQLVREQLQVEEELIRCYRESAGTLDNGPARHLLKMMETDSMRHKDLCQLALAILQGEDMQTPSEEHIEEILKPHHDLEESAIDRLNTVLKNPWIKQNKGLNVLIKKMRNDEKRHHDTLENLIDKTFTRLDPDVHILSPIVMDAMVRFLFAIQ